MAYKYMTQEWMDAIKQKSQTDEAYQKKMKGFTERLRSVVTDCPGGVDVLQIWGFEDGKVVEATMETAAAPSEWRNLKNDEGFLSTSLGGFEDMTAIAKGELNAQVALAKKKYVIHGNMLKVFAKMGKINAFGELCGSIDTEY